MSAEASDAGVPCMLMRGGTSKGAFFLAADLPSVPASRDDLLLRIMGSPDVAQIDGLGGAHPLTSKVAVVSRSAEPGVDLDYLFLQIGVDEAIVGTAQTCGNLLAGVAPFGIERGLIPASDPVTTVRIHLLNTGDLAVATIATPGGRVDYDGELAIDGVPGTAGAISLETVPDPKARALLPTGNIVDVVEGFRATLIDGGMPVVLLAAADLGVTGTEAPSELEGRTELKERIEGVRRAAGAAMGLGDVTDQTVPKVFLLSEPRNGGAIATRAFIPHRVHTSIGVLMAASVAAGIRIPGALGSDLARPADDDAVTLIEHPGGSYPARVRVDQDADGTWSAVSTSLRTARKIFDGRVFPRPRR